MPSQKFSLEQQLFLFAVLLASLLRFTNLGASPLTDQEARLALQALQISQGHIPTLLNQPLLILVDSFLFFLFGSTNFIARFLPALCGTLLILSLYWLRIRIHPSVILVFAFALAVDPGMVSLSRQLDSTVPALSFLCFATIFWLHKKYSLAGIFAGLFLLCGAAAIFGLVTLGLAIFISLAFEKQIQVTHADHPLFGKKQNLTQQLKPFLTALGVTFLIIGSWFLRVPQGLSAAAGGLVEFFKGWTSTPSLPAGWIIVSLGLYHPIAVMFVIIAMLRTLSAKSDPNQRNGFQRFLGIWFLIALFLTLLYPNRNMSALIWVLIPLWLIAAQEMTSLLSPLEQPQIVPILQGIISFFFIILFGLQVAAYSLVFPVNRLDWVHLATIFSTVVLVALVVWLVNLGWSRRASMQGLALGWIAALLIFTLSGTLGSAFSLAHSQTFRQELWKPYPQIGDADLILKTIHDLSRWNNGNENDLAVYLAVDSPALQWLLRSQRSVILLPEENALTILSTQEQPHPAILITRKVTEKPSGSIPYRGQDFNWWLPPPWGTNALQNPLDWLLYRRAAWQPETIILWARADLFPGSSTTTAAQQELNPAPLSNDLQQSP